MNKPDLQTIWQAPIYLPYLQPKLTNEMVKAAETKMGYKLPDEYIDLLKTQNGGYIRYTIRETPHSLISGIGPYYPSITDFEWLKEYQDCLSFELDGLFPYDGDGHWNICLDYRNNRSEPAITYIDTESDYEQPIAKTFRDYLALLEIETENKYVIDTNSTVEYILNEISNTVDIEFEKPDYWAYGYPVYRSKFNESWVWISPNKVPRSFIREGEERYEALKSKMEGFSLRFPEISENNLFITVSDDTQRQNLFDKLKKSGLIITELKDSI